MRPALADGLERGPGEGLGVGVPLVGEPGLDDGVRAVAVRDGVRVRLDLRQQAQQRHHVDDPASRDEAVLTVDAGDEARMVVIALQPLEEVGVAFECHAPLRIEDVDRPHALILVPLADLEIVEVMRGGDLDRARALLGVGIVVGDDRDQPADQRQANSACR